ncbi:energy-coupling factor transporter transmembrane component T family protein [Lactobacillus ultunensis]|uniref:Cobalt transport protein n=1 Tax=Lactobacillus ultunensis DSM 16047 TaxID=525365 RepID=C2EQ66_9LACO|nr:energy-coupling factor transporter transmembrane component T [Lactobacillus ultunensis]EEJ71353.1 cobalt transport protein [Lactobacillus ultunensis DSM 16047]KRL81611.1 ABC superfamily ATP binding cassette transporter permease protein [Lactobacillus ultunensis DSM 16047]QQP28646.1 energy-coupling factor transporter transmembrane protein EcfT [Lactobacillus ultunensis]
MNPSLKFILAFIISLEISLKASLTTNILVIVFALIYLICTRIKIKELLLLIILPFIAAFTIFATLYWFSPASDPYYAWDLSTRVYVYTLTIACVTRNVTVTGFARSLEQNLHLPSKFAYGVLAAINIIPKMRMAVKQIRAAAMMRGMYLSFWSPVLYFKAILVALNSADNLAQGMESHGYVEDQKRSTIVVIPLTKKDWLIFFGLLILTNISLFLFK